MLKFFATNRAIDRLGRAIGKRRSEENANFLSNDRIGSIVVWVHGFNVKFHEAFTWFRILTDTMKNIRGVGKHVVTSPVDLAAKPRAAAGSLTAFVAFSWPSNGHALSYLSDQRQAVDSKAPFASLLARLKSTGKSVNLIAPDVGTAAGVTRAFRRRDRHPVTCAARDAGGKPTLLRKQPDTDRRPRKQMPDASERLIK